MLARALSEAIQGTVGMLKVEDGSNEITALPRLIRLLHLKDKIVTIDAIGTQKEIVQLITEKNADYTLPVKGNQRELHENIKFFLDNLDEYSFDTADCYNQLEKGHGRIEKRHCIVTQSIEWLDKKRVERTEISCKS